LLGTSAAFAAAAVGVRAAAPAIERRSAAHFAQQARIQNLPQDMLESRARGMAQKTIRFFPIYYGGLAVYAGLLGLLIITWPSLTQLQGRFVPPVIVAICLVDLFVFGRNYNPAIPLARHFPDSPITKHLQDTQAQAEPFRVLSLEEEFPPNVLGRYRIADMRNYDAIELRQTLDFFQPLWPSDNGRRTSTSWTTWARVQASMDLLRFANVRYVISTTPPSGIPGETEAFGRVQLHKLEHVSGILFSLDSELGQVDLEEPAISIECYRAGNLDATVQIPPGANALVFSESFMPGWQARIDGKLSRVEAYRGAFISVAIAPGTHRVQFDYAPKSFRLGLVASALGVAMLAGLFVAPLARLVRGNPVA
jgi:hypothetical protein